MRYLIALSLLALSFLVKGQTARKHPTAPDSVANVKVFFTIDEKGDKSQIKILSLKCNCDSATKVRAIGYAYQYVQNMDVSQGIKEGQPSAEGYTLPLKIKLNK